MSLLPKKGDHRGSITNVGTVDPPPAVTFKSGSVLTRVRHPAPYSPSTTYGAVSTIRSPVCSLLPTHAGNGSEGSFTLSWATCGTFSAVRTASSHFAWSTSHPSTTPL